ncbi:Tas retrotransposon peptidase A16 [Oesophagostomum dentatum]|uniref:Tas retrotransposon peptidase A16 n=1 Tax=Oesophagostomum dentatum TaxID=61180 RepID=A0A0B1TS57_OESDE|nr:Tas retrotransposon peptidase A16 [Oesophagostomum dentatum]
MAEIAGFMSHISMACSSLNALGNKVHTIDQPFDFPNTAAERTVFVAEKSAEIDELSFLLADLLQNLKEQVQNAMAFTGTKKDQSEREKLMTDLDKFLNEGAIATELKAVQCTSRLRYRQRELDRQSSLIQAKSPSVRSEEIDDFGAGRRFMDDKIRLPQLEVPVFHGNYKDYPTFWTTYNSLIHSNPQLSNADKFLFLKQALRGSAAALIGTMPPIGDNYEKAVKLLDKRFNNCRKTLTKITEKLTHIECSGIPLDNSRMWRRLMLSKFPDTMSEKVLCKEEEQGRNFSTDEIVDILEGAIAMKETIALTTEAFQDRFSVSQPSLSKPIYYKEAHSRQTRESSHNHTEQRTKQRAHCVCGSSTHGVTHCSTFTTPEARRNKATKRRLCWKCFNTNHKSSDCRLLKACPKCNKDHHSALCLTDRASGSFVPQPTSAHTRSANYGMPGRKPRASQNAEVIHADTESTTTTTTTAEEQYVLMTATALAFNTDSMNFEPVTVFFDTGAQKSFINGDKSQKLSLLMLRNASFTVSGFGGKTESFVSNETTLDDSIVTLDILVGQDLIDKFLLRDQPCVFLPSGLVLTPTIFGYEISGRSAITTTSSQLVHSENGAVVVATPVLNLAQEEYKQDIKNLYELESVGIKLEKDGDEESVLRFMNDYRKSIVIENVKRLQALFRVLQSDPEKMHMYNEALGDYAKQEMIEELQGSEEQGITRKRIALYQPVHIYHVPTEENVADHATRGLTQDEARNHVWFKGPIWLNREQSTWPVRPVEDFTQKEKDACFAALTATQEVACARVEKRRVWPTEKISSYDKLRRITAYCLQFIRNSSKSKFAALNCQAEYLDFNPNTQEMMQAERYLLQEEQQQADLESLLRSTPNIKFDSNGLVRKFGRLQNSDLSYNTVNPIYLPQKGVINKRVAEDLHRRLCHCGTNQLVHALRETFCIPADKSLCKRILRNCAICQRYNAAPFKNPHMGPLPAERVTQSPPFSFTGVDLTIKNILNEDEERYIALFTCLVTQMVHLEVTTDLSARSFLLVFKRYKKRNDTPTSSEFSFFIAKHNIQWSFIPPASPWMGGAWERMVGTVKRALFKSLGRRKLSEEILATVLCEVESAVNSRPLIIMGEREEINEVLRPVDFVYKNIRHDVVLIDDDLQTPRDHWPMGLIKDLVRSKDGEIRSVMLKTSTGRLIQRPLNRLIPLEIHASASETLPDIRKEPLAEATNDTHDTRKRPLLENEGRRNQ